MDNRSIPRWQRVLFLIAPALWGQSRLIVYPRLMCLLSVGFLILIPIHRCWSCHLVLLPFLSTRIPGHYVGGNMVHPTRSPTTIAQGSPIRWLRLHSYSEVNDCVFIATHCYSLSLTPQFASVISQTSTTQTDLSFSKAVQEEYLRPDNVPLQLSPVNKMVYGKCLKPRTPFSDFQVRREHLKFLFFWRI